MKFGLSYLLYMHSDLSFKLLFLKQTLIGNIGKFKKLFNNPFFLENHLQQSGRALKKEECLFGFRSGNLSKLFNSSYILKSMLF